MTLTKYDPLGLSEFPTTWRLLNDSITRLFSEPQTARPWSPSVDIVETDNDIIMKADVPGINEKDIDIQIEDGTLTLKGERKFEEEKKGEGYHRIERAYGSFARTFALPDSVDTDKVTATYKNGVLTVKLPKKEVAKPKSVKVAVG